MGQPTNLASHYTVLRGLEATSAAGRSEGRFSRLFEDLSDAGHSHEALIDLASHMTASFEAMPTPETESDTEENSGMSAGYTFLGQFIDHDLTFDPACSMQRQNDPHALKDFRIPRFDLDGVYGRGPTDQPYLYRSNGLHMLLGRPLSGADNDPGARDVPRTQPVTPEPSRAIIADPRNNENVILSQLHAAFLRFHNHIIDFLGPMANKTVKFGDAQRLVRFHYQWLVLNDFLPIIIGEDSLNTILPNIRKGTNISQDPPRILFFKPAPWGGVLPVEFSAAAYRFLDTTIRPMYRLNTNVPRIPILSHHESLIGFRDFPDQWAVDWSLFFKLRPAPEIGPSRIQPAYKIGPSLVAPLGSLPSWFAPLSSVAGLNLLVGASMQLPSGQAVARHMGIQPIPDDRLRVGISTMEDIRRNGRLDQISPDFKGKAPLWYYILAEAQQQVVSNTTPIHLGPVGGRIVGEVIAGLMLADQHSFLNAEPGFRPIPEFCSAEGKFGMAELLEQAAQA